MATNDDFSTIPESALRKPEPFTIHIPDQDIQVFRTLLKLSKIPAPTYESLQEDGKFGISRKWIAEAKEYWEKRYDWQVWDVHVIFSFIFLLTPAP